MITFTQLGNYGRLGNQLFQYAALKSLGLHNNYEVKIPNPKNKSWHGQQCLLDNFNIDCGYLTTQDIDTIQYQYREIENKEHFMFDEFFFNIPNNTDILGFFQNTKYFEKFKEQIITELTPKQQFRDLAKIQISNLHDKYRGYEIVSLHIRRGDNTDGTNSGDPVSSIFGNDKRLEKNSVYGNYLQKSKNVFSNKKVKFLIFTGGSRVDTNNISDFQWCKENFVGDEYIFIEPQNVIEDFTLMSLCQHNINCHSTSFGWWASYINPNKNKIVVCPKSYSIPDDFRSEHGFYPNEWLQL